MITRDSKFVPIKDIDVSIYTVPTDFPESDGTLEWNSTTLVLVQASAGNKKGLGHTYADTATANPVHHLLAKAVEGRDAMAISACWNAMVCRTRNLGRAGIVSTAISAVDSALWDLKARLLDIPLVTLLGRVRESVSHLPQWRLYFVFGKAKATISLGATEFAACKWGTPARLVPARHGNRTEAG